MEITVKKILLFGSICILTLTTSCKGPNTISLIGIDESGKEVDIGIDKTIYQKALTGYVKEMDRATVNALETNADSTWVLSKVEVGLLVTATLSAGPVWKWGYSAGQRIIFTKN